MPRLRGLQLLETIDVHGPLTVTEIARVTGQDKSWVSRIVSACEEDGWIIRDKGRIGLGPRAALLAHSSAAGDLIRRAQPLVEAVAGVTGLMAQAYALVGSRATVVAAAGGGNQPSAGIGMRNSLVATAAGQVIAAGLDAGELERVLPAEPFPDPLAELLANPGYIAFATGRFAAGGVAAPAPRAVPGNRGELIARLEQVREQGFAIDHGDLHPQLGCLAVPWPGATGTAALACMGTPAEIAATDELARRVLETAAAPGATREDIASAAVGGRHYSFAP